MNTPTDEQRLEHLTRKAIEIGEKLHAMRGEYDAKVLLGVMCASIGDLGASCVAAGIATQGAVNEVIIMALGLANDKLNPDQVKLVFIDENSPVAPSTETKQ